MNRSILIVEDDGDIREMLEEALALPGYTTSSAADGQEALDLFSENAGYDLLVLDLMLPRVDGLTVLKKIRAVSTVPVLILSARNEEYEKVLGLEYGADDYITKPFSVVELQARVKACLRRNKEYQEKESSDKGIIRLGELLIDTENLTASKGGRLLKLTAKEYELLKLFALHPSKVYTKVQLYQEIWDDEFLNDENVINVTIRRLREKIEDNPSQPRYIKTVWGIGYKLESE
ncbi:response regulator transcription factor [Lactonifactor longoviformis]|uniref:response regulator transcription factor n=1 Tax=Lactonifactor TaxID=420345 RepID=UPI0012B0C681|nr:MULTISPECIES: response regulator transcription factor [Lactonifactor]MCB5713987.1 response regulator transcription factor [Lactonifactor longoviformis]MCB5718010.1 response regulator transcription factor [Lactonifactor longoviformis]MCQ4672897.1 response regulator transcription factor [Lactonifactor longoviformis]MSA03144.1 response regulator [Lactonifactor sp. BIOML-A5]MSA09377.1 response regulator [Lactonifactor sp. BIOML-A4]